jgi:M6 family metalloprotease-like protein
MEALLAPCNLLAVLAACGALASMPRPLAAQVIERTGTITIVWVDPRSGPPQPPQFHFATDAGERWQLDGVQQGMVIVPVGQVGLRVRLSGALVAATPKPGQGAPPARLRVQSVQPMAPLLVRGPSAVRVGTERYVTLRCLIPSAPPDNMPAEATLRRWLGTAYPGVGHLMTEMSRGQYTFDGSTIAGPYALPGTFETYVPPGANEPSLLTLMEACLTLADPDVDFSQVAGVNIQYNMDAPFAYGGGFYLTRDGASRLVGATWMPSWSSASVYAHEVGHSMGWPHSGSTLSSPYASCWDVMSNSYCRYDAAEQTWIPTHTIAAHRLGAGWIPPARVANVPLGGEARVRLAASGAPIAAGAVEMVELERAFGSRVIVESRRRQGEYEGHIPGSGLVLHERVQAYVDFGGTVALVLDIDGNGNPNDAAAIWEVGEVLEDSLIGSRVEVLAAHPDGSYDVLASAGWRMLVEASGPGVVLVDGTSCTAPCSYVSSAFPGQYTVTAQPAPGKVLGRWEGDCSGTGPCVVVVRGSRRVRAVFGTPIAISSATQRPYGVTGTGVQDNLVATGGDGQLTWRVVSGQLPDGLTLSAAGAIRGTPTRPGTWAAELEAQGSATAARTSFAFRVVDPVRIEGAPTRAATVVGRAIGVRFTGSGGGGPLAWRIASGQLPGGMSLDAVTGELGGTPAQVGTTDVVIEARWDTLAAQAPFSVVVVDRVAIASDSARPAARMGGTVFDSLRATPAELVRWSLTSGSLPSGVSLSEQGVLAGVAREAGTFSFTVSVVFEADTATRAFGLTVSKPVLGTAGVGEQLLGGRSLSEEERRFLDLLGNQNGRVDLADVRAWLVDTGRLPPAISVTDAAAALHGAAPEGTAR